MSYKLYGANVSPFVRKVRIYLAEKGIAYEQEPVNPFSPPPNYRELSPLGKIPALVDGDKALADSSVICLYLERCNPAPALYPSDNYQYARVLWFEEFIDSGLMPIAGPQVFRPLVLGPVMMKQEVTQEVKAEAHKIVEQSIAPLWDYLEKELGGNEFFVGGRLSMADIAIAGGHVNLWHAGVDPDAARWPRLAAFLQRLFARPALADIIAEEAPLWNRRAALAAL